MRGAIYPTINSLEFLKGLVQATYSRVDGEEIYIETEKDLDIDCYDNPKGGWAVKLAFTDYFKEPRFRGDHSQPADDPEPHRDEQIIFVQPGDSAEKFCKDFITELERIDRADCPEVLDPVLLKSDT